MAAAALLPFIVAAGTPLVGGTAAQAAETTTMLSSLPWISAINGYGPTERDLNNGGLVSGDGQALRLQGQTFARGLGVHAASDVRFAVPAGCNRFTSTVGVDDAVGSRGSVVFTVYEGGIRRYSGTRMTGDSPSVAVSVPVTPGQVLRLVVTDAGDGISNDHADWADAKFTCVSTAPASTAPPLPSSSSSPSPSTGNVLQTAGAETGVSPWNATNAAVTTTTSPVRSGSGAFRLTASGPGHLVLRHGEVGTPVVPGTPVRLSAWVRSASVPRSALLQVDWSTSSGYLGTSGTPQVTTTMSGWTQVSAALTVPAGAVRGLFYVKFIDAVSGEVHYVDDVSVEIASAAPVSTQQPPTAAPVPSPTPSSGITPAPAASPSPTTPGAGSPASAGPTGQTGTWTSLFSDDFSSDALDGSKWSDHEPWQAGGYVETGSWNPSPHTAQQVQVGAGQAVLKARRGTGLPQGKAFTSAHINTRGKFSIPEGVTSYTEARLKMPAGRGLLPGFWLLGNGDNGTGEGWPINGEIDIVEIANNTTEAASPHWSLWFPKDVYTAAPGTFLNATHVYHTGAAPKRPELYDTYHTWGLFRSPSKMELYIDNVKIATYRPGEVHNGNIPLPPMLFTKAQHVRLSLIVGGWGGTGYTEAQYQEGDLGVDYVKVWKQTGV